MLGCRSGVGTKPFPHGLWLCCLLQKMVGVGKEQTLLEMLGWLLAAHWCCPSLSALVWATSCPVLLAVLLVHFPSRYSPWSLSIQVSLGFISFLGRSPLLLPHSFCQAPACRSLELLLAQHLLGGAVRDGHGAVSGMKPPLWLWAASEGCCPRERLPEGTSLLFGAKSALSPLSSIVCELNTPWGVLGSSSSLALLPSCYSPAACICCFSFSFISEGCRSFSFVAWQGFSQFKSCLAPSVSCGIQEQGVSVGLGRVMFTRLSLWWGKWTQGRSVSGFPRQKGSPGVLVAKILWTQSLIWMSLPGFLKPFSIRVVMVILQYLPVQR